MTNPQHPPSQDTTPAGLLDVVVIGGGQAGLAMAWHLTRRGMRFVVLEAGPELGQVWRDRWDSLKLFTPAQYSSLPGQPFPAPADTYPTRDAVADYMHAYAKAFDLPVTPNARVTDLRRTRDFFEVSAGDDVYSARQVVVATGPFQAPFTPPPARTLDPSVTQMHSAAYRDPQALPDGAVLVVGGGNSGLQIAEELAAGRQVDLSIGTHPPMLPQRLLGRDLFWWLHRLGLMRASADSRLGRRMQARGEFIIGTNRRRLQRAGVRFRPRVVDAHGRTVRFADDSTLDVTTVIWATGFRPDHSWLHIAGVADDGRITHRRGVTEVPGLYFLGLPWQHTRGSALLGFVHHDAAYLADRITEVERSTTPPPATARRHPPTLPGS
jgi:putative flavoprotein involved in K+ transport